ncbi:hypothetical protein [Streptomyces sp. NPDC048603]|uniref:hypothetical protein n=1 Tax=Streptomyces sp. NPDC048603 TaxID=3365577 RepID=UPI0037245F4C
MKLRHVRAIAVFGIAIVALTGARGSHGGSCGGGHGGSSSHGSDSGSSGSTGSGGSTTGGTTDSTTGGGNGSDSSTTGSTSGGTSVTGGSRSDKAERDIRIDSCKLDDSRKNLVARLTVTNNGSLDYTYDITMKFRGKAGSDANLALANVDNLKVKAGASQQAVATTPYTGKGDGSEYKECVVQRASKSAF